MIKYNLNQRSKGKGNQCQNQPSEEDRNNREVFPIKDLTETNPVYILTNKDKAYVEGTDELRIC